MGTVSQMILLGQVVTITKKPICPTHIHDDPTRIVIFAVGIVMCLVGLYYIMRYFNGT